jgi:hypothetical protein
MRGKLADRRAARRRGDGVLENRHLRRGVAAVPARTRTPGAGSPRGGSTTPGGRARRVSTPLPQAVRPHGRVGPERARRGVARGVRRPQALGAREPEATLQRGARARVALPRAGARRDAGASRVVVAASGRGPRRPPGTPSRQRGSHRNWVSGAPSLCRRGARIPPAKPVQVPEVTRWSDSGVPDSRC